MRKILVLEQEIKNKPVCSTWITSCMFVQYLADRARASLPKLPVHMLYKTSTVPFVDRYDDGSSDAANHRAYDVEPRHYHTRLATVSASKLKTTLISLEPTTGPVTRIRDCFLPRPLKCLSVCACVFCVGINLYLIYVCVCLNARRCKFTLISMLLWVYLCICVCLCLSVSVWVLLNCIFCWQMWRFQWRSQPPRLWRRIAPPPHPVSNSFGVQIKKYTWGRSTP